MRAMGLGLKAVGRDGGARTPIHEHLEALGVGPLQLSQATGLLGSRSPWTLIGSAPNGSQVKVYAWYDNEWGCACRLTDITRMVVGSM